MYITIDTETELIKRGCLFPPISCLTYYDEQDQFGIFSYKCNKIEQYIGDALEQGHHLIAHYASFDMGVLCENYPDLLPLIFQAYDEDRIHCTVIRQKLLDIALGYITADESGEKNIGFYTNAFDNKRHLISYSLKALHYRRTGEILEKGEERITFGPLRNIPLNQWPEKHKEYVLKDAKETWPIFKIQTNPKVQKYLECEGLQTRAAFCLHLISSYGLKTNKKFVDKLRECTQNEIKEYLPRLPKGWFVNNVLKQRPAQERMMQRVKEKKFWPKLTNAGQKIFDKNDKKGLATALVDTNNNIVVLSNSVIDRSDKTVNIKQLSLDKEACEDSGDKDLIIRQKFGSARTVLSKTIPVLEQGYYLPIQPSYEPLLATGRTSSYADKKLGIVGDNIQNQKRKPGVRECYQSRKGKIFCSVDYDTAELRTLAELCYQWLGKSTLGDAINKGFDPHLDFAANILAIEYTVAEKLKKQKDPKIKETRQISKAANFGYPGGSGPKSFRNYAKGYGVKLSEEKAKELKDLWLEKWPEMVEYFKLIGIKVKAGKGKAQIKIPIVNFYRGGCRFTVACNTGFQGLTAAGGKDAMWELIKAMYWKGQNDILFGERIAAFIHDEFIFEFKDIHPQRSIAADECARIMVKAFNKYVPHCPVKASPVLMYQWSKNADDEQRDLDSYHIPYNFTLEEIFIKENKHCFLCENYKESYKKEPCKSCSVINENSKKYFRKEIFENAN